MKLAPLKDNGEKLILLKIAGLVSHQAGASFHKFRKTS